MRLQATHGPQQRWLAQHVHLLVGERIDVRRVEELVDSIQADHDVFTG